jgi:hypothetical protein
MKQTAVEWLEEKFNNNNVQFINWSEDYFNDAKEMEKQQIIDAYDEGYGTRDAFGDVTENNTGEQYYNETFKNK